MAELSFTPVFQEITCTFRDEVFSTMYFGRHCGKNLIILKHDLSIILAFGENIQWSKPDLFKSISFRGDLVKGIQIVGNENVILMLDESGNLWRLINAFDLYDERYECLHLLSNESFYEWIPFRKFNFVKVLALCAMKHGFACVGLKKNFEKVLAVLISVDVPVEEFTFDGLSATDSFSYYLCYLDIDINNSVFKNKLDPNKDTLLVADRFRGKTFLCTSDGKNCLINQSNVFLICALHYPLQKCVTFFFESGKLVFYFYDEPERQHTVLLPRKLVAAEKCSCFDFCLLWSDGINLHHTKFNLKSCDSFITASHLKLFCAVQSPLSLLRIHKCVLASTINNIYYLIKAGSGCSVQIKKPPKELLNEISERSRSINRLEMNLDMLAHYLKCKDINEDSNLKGKVEIGREDNHLIMKSCFGVCLRHEFWKLRLKTSVNNKELVHTVDFKFDVSDGVCITIDNPFKSECIVKAILIGIFGETCLFLDLGEVGEPVSASKKNQVSKNLENILRKRNPDYAMNELKR